MTNKKRVIVISVALSLFAAVLFGLTILLFFFIHKGFVFNVQVITTWFAIIAVAGTVYFLNKKSNVNKQALRSNKDLDDTHFLTNREIKDNKGLTVTSFSRLYEVTDGVPVLASADKKNVKVILAKPIHTLVIGTTGSGKTTTFVDPTIEILSRTKTKPCMVITDPKGELYTHHAATLKEQGYTVLVLNLADVYSSARWNPFAQVIDKQHKIETLGVEKRQNKYIVFDKEFESLVNAEKEYTDKKEQIEQIKQVLTDEIFEDIQDLIFTMCPVENQHDSTWQKGARDLIFAVALAFWEDVRDRKMKPEQFNLFNLHKTITDYATADCKELVAYFDNRNKFSKTKGLANTVLVTEDRTLTSYLGDVNQYISFLADRGIQALTSGNDIDFSNFDEKPTALFIKIPDAKDGRHKLVSLLLVQMYKALVDKASENQRKGKTPAEELLRTCYFILDEFGNMPKLNKIDGIITVGRSRKIFMLPIIQNFKQLDNRYGKDIAEIVKSNCNIKIFIQAGDSATNEEFSKLCGKRKIIKKSFSENKDMSVSTSVEERPLITAYELQNLNDANAGRMGNAVVLALGKNPLKATFTPCFNAKEVYKLTESKLTDVKQPPFDENKIYYDIAMMHEPEAVEEDEQEILPQTVTDDFSGIEDDEDRYKALLEKRILSLKNAIRPYLTEQEYKILLECNPVNVLEFIDEIIDKMQSKDILAVVMAVELKNFIATKYLERVEVDMNSA
jgi:type IV secretion system protein VirD4